VRPAGIEPAAYPRLMRNVLATLINIASVGTDAFAVPPRLLRMI
jgi:hypothetical protein